MADMWEVLQQLGKFEWAVKRPYATEGGEALNFPPIFCWRYQNQSEEQLEIIRKAISTFKGKIDWEFINPENSKNWVIRPKLLNDVLKKEQLLGILVAAEYLAKKYPEFGQEANQEFNQLAEHFQSVFQNRVNKL